MLSNPPCSGHGAHTCSFVSRCERRKEEKKKEKKRKIRDLATSIIRDTRDNPLNEGKVSFSKGTGEELGPLYLVRVNRLPRRLE